MNKFCLIVFTLVLLASCRKDDAEIPVISGTDYYPTEIGSYRVYDVHTIFYNGESRDTTYQIMELIHDTLHMNSGITYELYRFYRSSDADAWPFQPDSVWRMTKNSYQLTIEVGSMEYVFLTFPFTANKQWNGNSKNVLSANTFTLKNIGTPYSYDAKTYAETCTVEESKTLNLIQKDYRNRIYAKDIGLIYKKYEVVTYKDDNASIGNYIIDFGSITEQKLIDYGNP